MPRRMVVTVRPEDPPTMLIEVQAHDEAQLQERLRASPDLLPIDEFGLVGPLMVVGRETTLPSGAADLLCLTAHGNVVIVELKTGPQNPDFRSALAQLLDYGSDLWGMTIEVFENSVAVRYFNAERSSGSPVHGAPSLDHAARNTWPEMAEAEIAALMGRLTQVLASGSFHYVVVAQRFTEPMTQTAGYLNTIASPARFYLVELVRFTGGGVTAFEARTVLKPSPRANPGDLKPSINESSFLAVIPEVHREPIRDFFDFCRGVGLRFEWGVRGTSIRLHTSERAEPISVGWVFPPGVPGWMGLTDMTFGYDPTQAKHAPASLPALQRYVSSLGAIRGAREVAKATAQGVTLTLPDFVENQSLVIEALAEAVRAASSDAS